MFQRSKRREFSPDPPGKRFGNRGHPFWLPYATLNEKRFAQQNWWEARIA
jgi:hypothetical protein